MSWLKISDRALADPRFTRASRDARLLHLEALARSMGYEGDGSVPRHAIGHATDAADVEALAAELVGAGLWTATDDGWQVVFMLDDQPSPDEIARQKAYNRAKSARSRRHRVGDHSMCDPAWCRAARDTGRVTGNDTGRVPNVDSTRPEGRGKKARFATSLASGGSLAPRAGKSRPMSDETKAKMRATIAASKVRRAEEEARLRAEAEERRAAEAARRAEEQEKRDAEWLALGGDPRRLPVSYDDWWRRKYPGKRQLR
jgi:hypothetical protein